MDFADSNYSIKCFLSRNIHNKMECVIRITYSDESNSELLLQ